MGGITIVEQFRDCLKDVPLGTQLKRQEIIDLIQAKYDTKASSIIPSDYCYNMVNKGIPADHVSFFINIGTGLYEYVGEDYRIPTIESIIASYKANFSQRDDEERYKWEAIAHFQQYWNIEAQNFSEMFREAFRWAGEGYKRPRDGKLDGGNLLTSSMYYPYRMIVRLSEFESETMRSAFKDLLNESEPLSNRYAQFKAICDACLERLRASDPAYDKANNHYQDLRAVSVYLTFVYPEKYFLYKYRMYKSFADLIGSRPILETSKSSKVLSFNNYLKLCQKVLQAVEADKELQNLSKSRLDEHCYQDPSFHLLTMDIIYYGSQLAREGAYKVKRIIEAQSGKATDIGKNTILYGPPGTGKTYYTVIYAVAIIEEKPLSEVQAEPYEDVIERYNTYKAEGLIEFTTFHQSYGYEEFIEGIRPVMVESGDEDGLSDDIAYSVESGIFKCFCERAQSPVAKQTMEGMGINSAPTVWKVSLQGAGDNPTRTECLEKGHIRIGWDEWGDNPTDEMVQKAPAVNNIVNRMLIGDIVFSLYNATTIDAIGVVSGEYEWHDEYHHFKRLRPVNWLVKGIREDIVALNGGKRMTQLPIHQLNVSAADAMAIVAKHLPELDCGQTKKNNYVFVVDEINRGNISKIFGELITLIEPSKRIGQVEGATAKLPYSQKTFGVPDNVYLIGTMNTADRSIATLDTALRRRFQFKEMLPDPHVLDGVSVEDISISDLLERMNRKISVLYDREHTIGHGYFMPLRENPTIEMLATIFENNILPLLQEYFYDDYEKIRLVLGDNNKPNPEEQFIITTPVDYSELFGSSDVDMDEATSYEINKAAFDNIDAYRSI